MLLEADDVKSLIREDHGFRWGYLCHLRATEAICMALYGRHGEEGIVIMMRGFSYLSGISFDHGGCCWRTCFPATWLSRSKTEAFSGACCLLLLLLWLCLLADTLPLSKALHRERILCLDSGWALGAGCLGRGLGVLGCGDGE